MSEHEGAVERMKIAVMTSGGDAQGMNAFVRSVVRTGISSNIDVFAIYGGFQGLVDGDLRKMMWDDVSGFLTTGGTTIGTSRCLSYQKEFDVRTQVVYNLVSRYRVADGSLAGCDVLMQEWRDHLAALTKCGKLTDEQTTRHSHLYLVGTVGSIDNDMIGTDMTIGCDSALQRIIEALDAIMTTASSHQRSFVVEVMGRQCGYLALLSALATGADWVFIPECPVAHDEWKKCLADSVFRRRELGSKHSVVIVAEGAVDSAGEKITASDIKQVIEERAHLDTRVTVLGHIQRGGVPSAYDRFMSTIVGRHAVQTIASMRAETPTSPPVRGVLIGTEGDRISVTDLMEQVSLTKTVGKALASQDYEKAFKLRGHKFEATFNIYKTVARAFPHEIEQGKRPQTWGVMHGICLPLVDDLAHVAVGAPAPGMNAAIRAIVRLGLDRGHTVYGIYNGFAGLVELDCARFGWYSVAGWSNLGGALLGANRDLPNKVEGGLARVAESLRTLKLDGLIIVGGWEAYESVRKLSRRQKQFPVFAMPMVLVPATISNNCPGTHHSIGSDTAVNTIVEASDRIKLSAMSSRRRVFVVETMGGHCGYLTLISAIAGGAQIAYLPEHGVKLQDIVSDIERLKSRFRYCRSTSLILNNEKASKVYTTKLIHDLMAAESEKIFSVRLLILGHVQQGNAPSPRDRELAASLAFQAVDLLHQKVESGEVWHGCVGEQDAHYTSCSFPQLDELMDRRIRRPRTQWWEGLWEVVSGLRSTPKHDIDYRPFHDTMFQETKPFVNLARISSVSILKAASSSHFLPTPRSSSNLSEEKDQEKKKPCLSSPSLSKKDATTSKQIPGEGSNEEKK